MRKYWANFVEEYSPEVVGDIAGAQQIRSGEDEF